MKRKVVKQGPSTLVISLPSKWAKDHKISQGDELSVLLSGNHITFSKSEQGHGKKEAVIDVDKYWNHFALSRYLAVLYKLNYDKVTLVHSKPGIYLEKGKRRIPLKTDVQEIAARFIGAEVISQSSSKIEIEFFVTEENPDLEKLAKRIFFLMKETTEELISSIGKNYSKFHETIDAHHDNISRFVNYYLRTLYASEKSDDEKKFAFAFYSLVDIFVDKIRHLSKQIAIFGCTPRVKKYIKEIFNCFYEQLQFLDQKEISQEAMMHRYNLKNEILNENFNIKEYKVISEIAIFLDAIINFSEYVIARNLDRP